MPTDTTIIDRLRKIAAANVCDLPNMGDEAHEPPEITWGELDEIGRTAAEAADALTAAHAARDAAEGERDDNERAALGLMRMLAKAIRERDEARAAHKAPDA